MDGPMDRWICKTRGDGDQGRQGRASYEPFHFTCPQPKQSSPYVSLDVGRDDVTEKDFFPIVEKIAPDDEIAHGVNATRLGRVLRAALGRSFCTK
jgi:hypothetical protein